MLNRRDLGSGVLPARLGPARAGATTRGVFGLAWRLHRGTLLGWMIGLLATSLVFGSIAKNIGVLTDSARVQQIMSDVYVSVIMGLFGIIVAVFALSVVVRARSEETGGRIESVFSEVPSRYSWMLSHAVFAILGSMVLLAITGIGAGVSEGLGGHDVSHVLPSRLGAAFMQLPAVVLVTTLVLFAVLPRHTAAGWGLLGVFGFPPLAGPELKVSHYVLDISPFTHVPKLPAAAVSATPLITMGVLALLGVAITLAAFAAVTSSPSGCADGRVYLTLERAGRMLIREL